MSPADLAICGDFGKEKRGLRWPVDPKRRMGMGFPPE
jgi:hypothetical protein